MDRFIDAHKPRCCRYIEDLWRIGGFSSQEADALSNMVYMRHAPPNQQEYEQLIKSSGFSEVKVSN